MIHDDNSVRAIDPFVNSLDFDTLGFQTITWQGRPPYNPSDLLKLYIYCYMNRIRSSRQLELECSRNIEIMRLLGNIKTSEP
ncbi:transposase [Flavobacteriaceae bacterium M23B6Z8]